MRKIISVLYLDNTFTFGGAINSLLYLLRALDKKKVEPILVTGQPEIFLKKYFDFIKWYYFKIKVPWIHNKIYKKILEIPIFSEGIGKKIVDRFRFLYWLIVVTLPETFYYCYIGKKHKIQIVHLNNILGSQVAGILAAKFLGVPCVAHLRDFEKVNTISSFLAKKIDFHIAISKAIRDNLLNLKVHESNITIISDAIDLNDFNDTHSYEYLRKEFGINDEEKIFGIFGRIINWKGIKEFVHAAALIIQSVPNTKALIVGDCSDGDQKYLDEVRALITHYGLEQKIILTGYRGDVPALMGLMNLVVHASIKSEPFGMVLIEAMAMGKPVVAAKMGGPLDIVEDGKTGFLVEPGNIDDLANAIRSILNENNLAEFMGQNGKDRVVELFTKERYAKQVEKIYFNLLKDI